MALPNNPQTRKEMYLSNMAGQGTALPSEPHTREEEYLDYIAKNGGGGGTGEGDMTKAVYDDDLAVASAGGIADYVAGAITGKVDKVQGKGLSTNDYDDSAKAIVDGVTTALEGKVSKSNTAGLVKNDGTIDTTTTGAVAANTSAISAIKDGTNIDSFGDVETALAGKMPNYGIGIGLYVDSGTNQLRADAVTKAIKDSPKLITSGAVFSGLSPKYSTAEQEETDLDGQDKFPFYDYSASAKRHTTFGNIKAKLKEYFDSLYVAAVAGKGLSTNDYDNTAKGIVDNIQSNVIANTKLIKDTVGWSGKNVLEIKAVTRTLNGVTLTIQDGIVTLNGTATASNQINLNDTSGLLNSLTQKYGDLILNGSPALTNCRLYTHIRNGSYVTSSNRDETPILASTDYDQTILLQFDNGATFNNVQFKPMLRPKYILDNSFEPHFGSTAFPRSEQAVLGAKNLCPVISIGGRDSDSTLTYTVNTTDNTAEVNGTAAHAGWAVLANTTVMLPVLSRLAGKTIKFSGGLNNAKHLILRLKETSSSSNIDYVSYGSDVDVSVPSNIANYNRIEILLSININTVCSNDVLKPMISFDGGEYVPPAMTNRELTDWNDAVTAVKEKTINITNAVVSGHITSGSSEIIVSLPLRYSGTFSGATISCTSFIVRGGKGYIKDENGTDMLANYDFATGLKVSAITTSILGVVITIKNKNDGVFTNVDNNTPLDINFSGTASITLS